LLLSLIASEPFKVNGFGVILNFECGIKLSVPTTTCFTVMVADPVKFEVIRGTGVVLGDDLVVVVFDDEGSGGSDDVG